MANESHRFVPVYATGSRLHFDWARGALDDAEIPYFAREYNAGGLRLALPAFPTAGPGISWTLWVPDVVASAAAEEIEALPFDKAPVPGLWDFCAYPEAIRFWRMLTLVGLIVVLFPGVISLLLTLLRR